MCKCENLRQWADILLSGGCKQLIADFAAVESISSICVIVLHSVNNQPVVSLLICHVFGARPSMGLGVVSAVAPDVMTRLLVFP